VRSDPKHRQLARQVGGVSTIQASSMVVTFHSKIAMRPGSVFCFGTISSVADEEGILHRLADLPERKSPPTNSENAGKTLHPVLRKKIISGKAGAESPLTRRTPLSTSPTKEWTQIARKKETKGKQVVLSVPPPSKENGRKVTTAAAPFYPDVLFIGRVESPPVSDDEPTAPGEEPPQRESR
jgi:ADP-heptose:LPS heptosyltransferase